MIAKLHLFPSGRLICQTTPNAEAYRFAHPFDNMIISQVQWQETFRESTLEVNHLYLNILDSSH